MYDWIICHFYSVRDLNYITLSAHTELFDNPHSNPKHACMFLLNVYTLKRKGIKELFVSHEMFVVCVCTVNTYPPQNYNYFPITSGHILVVHHPPLTHTTASPSATFPVFLIPFPPLESLIFLYIHLLVSLTLFIVVSLSLLLCEEQGEDRKYVAGREDQIVPVLLSLNCCNLKEARRNCV